MYNKINNTIKIVSLAVILSVGMGYIYAWTGPTDTPPNGNVSAPINTSSNNQTKAGGLTLSGGLTLPTGAGDGKVLTSDATGKASWQTSAFGSSMDFSAAGAQTSLGGVSGGSTVTGGPVNLPGAQPNLKAVILNVYASCSTDIVLYSGSSYLGTYGGTVTTAPGINPSSSTAGSATVVPVSSSGTISYGLSNTSSTCSAIGMKGKITVIGYIY